MNLPKSLVLDYNNWICGSPYIASAGGELDSKLSIGEGITLLENEEGYRCCLGQFSVQAGLKSEDIMGAVTLSALTGKNPQLHIEELVEPCDISFCGYADTILARSAMSINDNSKTSVEDKVKSLKLLFKESGVTIETVNFPPDVDTSL
tara:strand:- start:373 stop:819 length:447 start_codon:yes stop_codon:yes gene_type:complete